MRAPGAGNTESIEELLCEFPRRIQTMNIASPIEFGILKRNLPNGISELIDNDSCQELPASSARLSATRMAFFLWSIMCFVFVCLMIRFVLLMRG